MHKTTAQKGTAIRPILLEGIGTLLDKCVERARLTRIWARMISRPKGEVVFTLQCAAASPEAFCRPVPYGEVPSWDRRARAPSAAFEAAQEAARDGHLQCDRECDVERAVGDED